MRVKAKAGVQGLCPLTPTKGPQSPLKLMLLGAKIMIKALSLRPDGNLAKDLLQLEVSK